MKRNAIEFIREGKYAVEVPIGLIEGEEAWSPCLSLDDARRLEAARLALRKRDIATAARYGDVFGLLQAST
jgi:hypothetical protein